MDLLFKAGLTALACLTILALVWGASRAGRVFVIRIRGGALSLARGRVSPEFLEDARAIVAARRIASGSIRGVAESGRTRLEFSKEIPADCRQRLRNVWVAASKKPRGG